MKKCWACTTDTSMLACLGVRDDVEKGGGCVGWSGVWRVEVEEVVHFLPAWSVCYLMH